MTSQRGMTEDLRATFMDCTETRYVVRVKAKRRQNAAMVSIVSPLANEGTQSAYREVSRGGAGL